MTKDEALDLALEIMHNQGDVGVDEWRAAEAAIKQARSAPVQPVAWWIPKAEQFCIADPSGRPFAKAWQPLYTTPPAQTAPVQVSPLEFVTMVMEKEHLAGKPLFWAEWPNKENT